MTESPKFDPKAPARLRLGICDGLLRWVVGNLEAWTAGIEHPKARFILAFADQAAAGSVVGWQRAAQDRHGIERVVVKLPQNLKKRLLEAQATLKGGMETGAG